MPYISDDELCRLGVSPLWMLGNKADLRDLICSASPDTPKSVGEGLAAEAYGRCVESRQVAFRRAFSNGIERLNPLTSATAEDPRRFHDEQIGKLRKRLSKLFRISDADRYVNTLYPLLAPRHADSEKAERRKLGIQTLSGSESDEHAEQVRLRENGDQTAKEQYIKEFQLEHILAISFVSEFPLTQFLLTPPQFAANVASEMLIRACERVPGKEHLTEADVYLYLKQSCYPRSWAPLDACDCHVGESEATLCRHRTMQAFGTYLHCAAQLWFTRLSPPDEIIDALAIDMTIELLMKEHAWVFSSDATQDDSGSVAGSGRITENNRRLIRDAVKSVAIDVGKTIMGLQPFTRQRQVQAN